MNELSRAFVPEDALDAITERVNRVIRRAVKKGFPAPAMSLGDTETRPVTDDFGEPIPGQFAKWVEVIIEGEPIRFSGWELIGVVSFIEDANGSAKPIVDRVPGNDDVEGDLPAIKQYDYCDHCQTIRRRNETFIVINDGVVRQVGRNCLKDFLGHSPSALLAMYDAYNSLRFSEDEVRGWGYNATIFYPPEYILRIASRIIAKEGYYVSRARAEEDDRVSTGELVRNFISAKGIIREKWEEKYPESDEAILIRELTLGAIPNLDPFNEYESKLIDLASAKGVQWRHIGTLASGVIQGLRARERKARAQAKGDSHFLGQVGDRLTMPVKVTMKRTQESAYGIGISYLIRMLANDGDDLIWWASYSETTKAIEEGDEFEVTGTVKDHEYDKYTERPTTVLTRCKVGEKKNG